MEGLIATGWRMGMPYVYLLLEVNRYNNNVAVMSYLIDSIFVILHIGNNAYVFF